MLITEPLNRTFLPNGLEDAKQMTKRYLDFLEKRDLIYKPNTVKHERLKLPHNLNHLKDPKVRREYQEELFRRWKYGHEGMCGSMYAHYNYFKIHDRAKGGMIQPDYRHYENLTFSLIESCMGKPNQFFDDNSGKGVIYLSRRGFGKSADFGSVALSAISTHKEITVKITSKDEADVQKFLKEKIKMTYYRVPTYLRYSELVNNRGELHVGLEDKTKEGLTFITGNDSKIIACAPTIASLEGGGAYLVVIDESGKIKGLVELVDNMLPGLCAKDGITRVGTPLIGGVAGEVDVFGTDYEDLWNKANLRDLMRWFVPGWAGIFVDEYGNDDIERACEAIFTKRFNARQISLSKLTTELKQYPLTPEEALSGSTSGVLNREKILHQCATLGSNPKLTRPGRMEWLDKATKTTIFHPDDNGLVEILENPIPKLFMDRKYIGFIDAYDIQEKNEKSAKNSDGSVGALYIFKRDTGLSIGERKAIIEELMAATELSEKLKFHLALGYLPVAEYIEGQDQPEDFAEEAAKLMYHYNAMTLVERYPSVIINYLLKHYQSLIQYKALLPGQKVPHDYYTKFGVKITEDFKKDRTAYLQTYTNHDCPKIYFPRLLNDMMEYDPEIQRKKKDSVDAFGGCLIHDKQPYLINGQMDTGTGDDDDILWGVTDNSDGTFELVN